MFYHFELDEYSKQLCTIGTPFGKYQYCRLPMGIKCAPDIAQQHMEQTLNDIDCEVYIDDIAAFSNSWSDHLNLLKQILSALEEAGFTLNKNKCNWAVKSIDFLGYHLTPIGLQPCEDKIKAILNMSPPTNTKQVRSFIGAVNFYRDLFPRRAHIMAPLTNITGKQHFVWNEEHQKAFDIMKSIVAADVMMQYPNHNEPFVIYSDASNYQLGSCIMQNNKPVAYFSRKLTQTQINYTTMEKELLAVVETLKEFRSMLLGSKITVYTDHKNLTFKNFNNQRVLRWRLYVEDFDVIFKYIVGKENVLSDAFSRLPQMPKIVHDSHNKDTSKTNDLFYSLTDSKHIMDCFLNIPSQTELPNPLAPSYIQKNQFEDLALNKKKAQHPLHFPVKTFMSHNIIHYRSDPSNIDDMKWKIAIPTKILPEIIVWFHLILGHAGQSRVYDTIRSRFHHPNLKSMITSIISACPVCRQNKLHGPGYGYLPPKTAPSTPWQEVHVDLIGPWKVKVNNTEIIFDALTCIDPVTNLAELIHINNKTSKEVAEKFRQSWLCRYPWPIRCIHDNGGEFVGYEFQQLLHQCNIKSHHTTSKNPQSNAICERMHQTVGNILRTILHAKPSNQLNPTSIIDEALLTTVHCLRSTVSRSLNQHSPGEIAFNRHMFLDLPITADLHLLNKHRSAIIRKNLKYINKKRIEFDYQPGQSVYIKEVSTKLGSRSVGPFPIQSVHTNGTVTIIRNPGTKERINIRRLIPAEKMPEHSSNAGS